MLIVGNRCGPAPHKPTAAHRRAPQPPSPRLWSTGQRAATIAPCDRGAAFQVQQLLAQQGERRAPPPAPTAMLAAYHTRLSGRIRYFGPLTPVDLRV